MNQIISIKLKLSANLSPWSPSEIMLINLYKFDEPSCTLNISKADLSAILASSYKD